MLADIIKTLSNVFNIKKAPFCQDIQILCSFFGCYSLRLQQNFIYNFYSKRWLNLKPNNIQNWSNCWCAIHNSQGLKYKSWANFITFSSYKTNFMIMSIINHPQSSYRIKVPLLYLNPWHFFQRNQNQMTNHRPRNENGFCY